MVFILENIFMFPATFESLDSTKSALSVSSPQKNVTNIFVWSCFSGIRPRRQEKKQIMAPESVTRWRHKERSYRSISFPLDFEFIVPQVRKARPTLTAVRKGRLKSRSVFWLSEIIQLWLTSIVLGWCIGIGSYTGFPEFPLYKAYIRPTQDPL